jgi:membrane protease YdiL (CAAX protease family)
MTTTRSTRAPIVAILVILTAALFARSFLRVRLQEHGIDADFAKDLSYLVVPVILGILLFPILRDNKMFLIVLFRRKRLTIRLVLTAVAIAVMMRIAWWCQLVVKISFGLGTDPGTHTPTGPSFSFGCPPLAVIALGFIVTALLVPIIEEIVHRGLIQSSMSHHGPIVAITTSAFLFAIFHPPASYLFVFTWGIVFGVQFWNSQNLWPSLISHATYNGLIQLDWRCVTGTWNPTMSDLPLVKPGIIAITGLAFTILVVTRLLTRESVGVHDAPRH